MRARDYDEVGKSFKLVLTGAVAGCLGLICGIVILWLILRVAL